MEFQGKLRVAEIEKSNLEGEIQLLRDQIAQRKAEADKSVSSERLGGHAGLGLLQLPNGKLSSSKRLSHPVLTHIL